MITFNTVICGMFGLGAGEIALIGGVLLFLFGGTKIPQLMKGLGQGMNEYKKAVTGINEAKEELKK